MSTTPELILGLGGSLACANYFTNLLRYRLNLFELRKSKQRFSQLPKPLESASCQTDCSPFRLLFLF